MCVYYVCVYVHINILGSLCCTPVNQHTSIKKKTKNELWIHYNGILYGNELRMDYTSLHGK